jgi:hypothetical protein
MVSKNSITHHCALKYSYAPKLKITFLGSKWSHPCLNTVSKKSDPSKGLARAFLGVAKCFGEKKTIWGIFNKKLHVNS